MLSQSRERPKVDLTLESKATRITKENYTESRYLPPLSSPLLPTDEDVQNIFKLQDSSSMTKKVIMDCEEAEKDWALEHLGKELVDKLSLDSETKSAMDSLFSSGAGYVLSLLCSDFRRMVAEI